MFLKIFINISCVRAARNSVLPPMAYIVELDGITATMRPRFTGALVRMYESKRNYGHLLNNCTA